MALSLVFMGTPDFAVPTLAEIVGHGHAVAAVYTRAPKPAGRGRAERKSPVHAMAERFGLPVLTPTTLRGEAAAATMAGHGADAVIVVAYGLILPKAVLDTPALGCLNLHASLLPRWRGAAPIQRAVMAGDSETGIAVMRMEEGLDTGPVAMAERLAIGPEATAGEVHDALARLGADLMVRALPALARGTLSFVPQAGEGVTYAHKIANADAAIDWTQPAVRVHDHIRGLSPYPGAYFAADLGKGLERIKVLRASRAEIGLEKVAGPPGTLIDEAFTIACGSGAVRLKQVQRAGRGVTDAADFLRGARLAAGHRFA